MTANEIKTSIKTVYRMLWEILALYEKTDCYKIVPDGEKTVDIWDYMGERLSEVRKATDTLFLGNEEVKEKLSYIADETELFVRAYERPGVVKRWRRINPRILFFDCSFDLMEKCPDFYREISWGLTHVKLSCYPDPMLVEARKRYFADAKKRIEDGNLRYTENMVFQKELLRTLTLVFENDLKEYL